MSAPTTPRRPGVMTRQYGVQSALPSIVPIHDKSPSLRDSIMMEGGPCGSHSLSLSTSRPSFLHRPHVPLRTPMSSAVLSVAGVTATAPARVPVPKRARETDDEYDGRSCGGGDYNNNSRPLPLTPRANRRAPDLTLDKQQAPCTPVRGQQQQQQQQPRDGGSAARVSKKAKLEDRIKAEERFRYKYSKAFPGFKFYFDSLDPAIKSSFSQRVAALGARVEDFFSNSVTHFITNKAVPTPEEIAVLENKENAPGTSHLSRTASQSRNQPSLTSTLRSPIKLKSARFDPLVTKAVRFQMKIWDEKKFDNVLTRLLPETDALHTLPKNPSLPHSVIQSQRPENSKRSVTNGNNNANTLSTLLDAEKASGLTHERDPTALRRDYRYFGKNSYWLLVEDMTEHHAPVMVKEYGRWRTYSTSKHALSLRRARALSLEDFAKDNEPPWPTIRDKPGKATPSWPVGRLGGYEDEVDGGLEDQGGDAMMSSDGGDDGFIELQVVNDGSDEEEDAALPPRQGGQPLRRTVSMHDLGRHIPLRPEKADGDDQNFDGEYLAASGNSVLITSNVNSTTSFAQHPLSGGSSLNGGPFSTAGGSRQLINKRLHRQVLTHRTLAQAASTVSGGAGAAEGHRILRKSKSTNTMRASSKLKARLPARDEVKKPGYCENCRLKFEDFNLHVDSRRHQKFANNGTNFSELDEVLGRLVRKTLEDEEEEKRQWEAALAQPAPEDSTDPGLQRSSDVFGDSPTSRMLDPEPEYDEWDVLSSCDGQGLLVAV